MNRLIVLSVFLFMTAAAAPYAQNITDVSPEMFIGAWYTTEEATLSMTTIDYPWGEGPYYLNGSFTIYSREGKVIVDIPGIEDYEIESVVHEPDGMILARLRMVTKDENPHKDTFRVRFLTQDSMLVDISGSNFFGLTKASPILYRISSPYTSQESSRKE